MVTFSGIETQILDALRAIVGDDNVSTGASELELHSKDQSFHEAHLPEVVVWGRSSQQVADVLKLANDNGIPVTPWGAGSSLEGNPIPLHGGILLSLARMDAVVEVHADDFQVTVQAGKPHKDLNADLAKYGLFFPPDPGANATIGGMLANNAAGIRTVKYGASKDNVLAATVALADGRLIEVGSRSVKQSAGYNLLHLFVGSEGTLGIITEATLKLAPIPEHRSTMIATFDDMDKAVEAVVAVRGSGVDVAALEFLDQVAAMMLARAGMQIAPNNVLLMEVFNAHASGLEEDVSVVRDLCQDLDCVDFVAMTDRTAQAKLWEARHGAYETMVRMMPSMDFQIMDVAVPISAYPELVRHGHATLKEHGLMAALVGHAGDSNLHVTLPYADEAGLDTVKAINHAIVTKAQELGGTATGEHGVGIGKMSYMEAEHGVAIDVMRAVKQTFDPNGILNPGKVLPA
ncbi:MAG: FAD-binding oxidoreductase [Chloroflexota bacterium]